MSKLIKLLHIQGLSARGLLKWMPDRICLKLLFKARTGKKLNLDNPQTFNEKLQWLKLYNRKPEYTQMVDKCEAKKHVAERIGDEYIIPTLGVWDRFDQIDFDALPDRFVLKCTHDSGGLIICRDKATLDKKKAKAKIERSLKKNYYWASREWPYKNVRPRIIAEQYVEDNFGTDSLPVYKIMTFGGVPKIIQTIQNDKMPNESIDYFDADWNLLDLRQNYPNSEKPFDRPEKLEEMLSLAKTLSQGLPFLRVDFYQVKGKVYFSEYTFYSDTGLATFDPPEWDETLGEWIQLP